MKELFFFRLYTLLIFTNKISSFFSFFADKKNKFFFYIISLNFNNSFVNVDSLMFKNAVEFFISNVNLFLYVYSIFYKILFFFNAFFFILIHLITF